MIEKALNLFERLVVAIELIAEAESNPLMLLSPSERGEIPCCGDDSPCKGKTEVDGSTAPEAEEPAAASYSTMSLDELKEACTNRGIALKPRMRSATMVKLLEDDDKNGGYPEDPVQPEPETSPDPGTPEPQVDAPDPFADETFTPSGPTVEDARVALRKLLPVCGSAGVIDLIKKHAGVEKIAMVPQSKFQGIIDEAAEILATGD